MEIENREIRKVEHYEIRQATEDDNSTIIEGYIAKFDTITELWEGYFEKIDRNAFNDTIADGHNIFLLYHHQWDKPLASTKTGTLELEVNNVGLRFKATINENVSYGKDVVELIKEGLIAGCSFGFRCVEEEIIYNSDEDTITRTLLKVELYEGSLLCIPQYKDTNVFARAKEIEQAERQKLEQQKQDEILKRKIELELELI